MKDESIKKAIVFFAKLIYRLSAQGKIYLSNKENTFIEYLRMGDFETFNKEGGIWWDHEQS